MACEANTAGAGFCIGELNMEEGSRLQGYMKKQRSAYRGALGAMPDANTAIAYVFSQGATPGTRSDAGPRSLSIACELLQYLL